LDLLFCANPPQPFYHPAGHPAKGGPKDALDAWKGVNPIAPAGARRSFGTGLDSVSDRSRRPRRPARRGGSDISRASAVRGLALLLSGFAVCACGVDGGRAEGSRNEIDLFCASSLREALQDAAGRFAERPEGPSVRLQSAGSQVLVTQILEGAPADLLVTADSVQMARVVDAGLVERPVPIAGGSLVIVVRLDLEEPITSAEDLTRSGLRIILGGPSVPVGRYARESLRRLGLLEGVEANVVSNEMNVHLVLGKILLGEADAGIVYRSDLTAHVAGRVHPVDFPEDAQPSITYWAALLKGAAPAAEAFLTHLRTPEEKAHLMARGFRPPRRAETR